jgi:RNA recognition motif-containing protein
VVACNIPSAFLVVRGFSPFLTEEQIMALFRQFAVVKNAHIIRDHATRMSKGLAFVEFQSVDHATYALQCSNDLKMDNHLLKVAFAKENVMQQLITQVSWTISHPSQP